MKSIINKSLCAATSILFPFLLSARNFGDEVYGGDVGCYDCTGGGGDHGVLWEFIKLAFFILVPPIVVGLLAEFLARKIYGDDAVDGLEVENVWVAIFVFDVAVVIFTTIFYWISPDEYENISLLVGFAVTSAIVFFVTFWEAKKSSRK